MRINFILPCLGNTPVGGLKIVYEYANHLHRKGHSVNVIHPITADKLKSIVSKAKVYRHYIQKKYNKSYKPDSWFSIDPNVNLVLVPYLEEKYIPDADFVIATAWNTAEPTANFSLRKGKKYYFIQNYEIWYAGKTEVLNTFKLPLKKIVISEWLGKLVKSQNENYSYVPNGFDFNAFGMDIDPAARNDNTLMMLYHKLNAKGSRLGLNAIRKAKKVIPELKLILFSAYPLSESLPDWIEFHYKPDQSVLRSLYNKAAVFVSPSFLEGFPLPPAEAMMSGAALVASDIGGHREYAIHDETALLYPPKNIDKLVSSLLELICNRSKRIKLATQGNIFIKQFTWERAANSFEEILNQDLYKIGNKV